MQDICGKIGVTTEEATDRLTGNGTTFDADETLKMIAERHDLDPIDLLKVILVEGYNL